MEDNRKIEIYKELYNTCSNFMDILAKETGEYATEEAFQMSVKLLNLVAEYHKTCCRSL